MDKKRLIIYVVIFYYLLFFLNTYICGQTNINVTNKYMAQRIHKNYASDLSDIGKILIGFAIALLTFGIKELFFYILKKRNENSKYRIVLDSTKDELIYYLGKLKQLRDDFLSPSSGKDGGKKYLIPSFSLYPNFLEKSKIDIHSFFRNKDIVRIVSECHFEISHINERLSSLKNRSQNESTIQGLKKLVETNIERFERAIDAIDIELKSN